MLHLEWEMLLFYFLFFLIFKNIKPKDLTRVKLNMNPMAIIKMGSEMEGSTCQGSEATSIIMPFMSALYDLTGE
jgi:hypothetical protein